MLAVVFPTPARSSDWVWSDNSNVSVAKDRGWFTSYTPFESHFGSLIGSSNTAVTGIGSVSIPVRLSSREKGTTHGTLTIDNVLHAPTIVCNILGQGDFTDRYVIESSSGIKNREGIKVACFDEKKSFHCLRLSGPPVGPVTTPSLFLKSRQGNTAYYINARWPDSERARWEAAQPYTEDEKACVLT